MGGRDRARGHSEAVERISVDWIARRVGKSAGHYAAQQTVDRGAVPTRRRTTRAGPQTRGQHQGVDARLRGLCARIRTTDIERRSRDCALLPTLRCCFEILQQHCCGQRTIAAKNPHAVALRWRQYESGRYEYVRRSNSTIPTTRLDPKYITPEWALLDFAKISRFGWSNTMEGIHERGGSRRPGGAMGLAMSEGRIAASDAATDRFAGGGGQAGGAGGGGGAAARWQRPGVSGGAGE